jgi:hypothetical protein
MADWNGSNRQRAFDGHAERSEESRVPALILMLEQGKRMNKWLPAFSAPEGSLMSLEFKTPWLLKCLQELELTGLDVHAFALMLELPPHARCFAALCMTA